MANRPIDVIAAGHICLDIIPQLSSRFRGADDIFTPGVLSQVGPAKLALGGSVANTGLALQRLGVKARLIGKVGDDLLGTAILEALRELDPSMSDGMVVSAGEPTSYTIVLSPPGVDRGFLHCPGTNDTFTAADLNDANWSETRLLHFGYPPLMKCIVADEGVGLALTFAAAQAAGALVSLDLATPNTDSTNWRQWLKNVLPHVDIFLPSLDEIRLMLDSRRGSDMDLKELAVQRQFDASVLAQVADELHDFGVPIVAIKLGDQGMYLSTTVELSAQASRSAWTDHPWKPWSQRRLLAPCFEVDVVGTTGSGDCTIAGFLCALLNGRGPEQTLRWATAVGAHCVESADATSNIPSSSEVNARLRSAWRQLPLAIGMPDWKFSSKQCVYFSPHDSCVS
jgi:sugar/nucleoside kinase (ribokinase family)